MQVVATFVSNVVKEFEKDIKARALAQVAGMKRGSRALEKDLENAASSAGLGRLARAWASKAYPDRAGVGSLAASSIVYVKGSENTEAAMYAFTHGVTIRAKNGKYLLIPTENAPKADRTLASYRGVIERAEAKYGKLRFVYRRGKTSLLVADNVRARKGKRGGFARASAKATAVGNVATIVVFILVPVVKLGKRFSIAPLEQKWFRQVPDLINQEYQRLVGNSRG